MIEWRLVKHLLARQRWWFWVAVMGCVVLAIHAAALPDQLWFAPLIPLVPAALLLEWSWSEDELRTLCQLPVHRRVLSDTLFAVGLLAPPLFCAVVFVSAWFALAIIGGAGSNPAPALLKILLVGWVVMNLIFLSHGICRHGPVAKLAESAYSLAWYLLIACFFLPALRDLAYAFRWPVLCLLVALAVASWWTTRDAQTYRSRRPTSAERQLFAFLPRTIDSWQAHALLLGVGAALLTGLNGLTRGSARQSFYGGSWLMMCAFFSIALTQLFCRTIRVVRTLPLTAVSLAWFYVRVATCGFFVGPLAVVLGLVLAGPVNLGLFTVFCGLAVSVLPISAFVAGSDTGESNPDLFVFAVGSVLALFVALPTWYLGSRWTIASIADWRLWAVIGVTVVLAFVGTWVTALLLRKSSGIYRKGMVAPQ